MPSTKTANQNISAVCRASQACISLVCRGSRGAVLRLSGVFGTTPSTWLITSASSVLTSTTAMQSNAKRKPPRSPIKPRSALKRATSNSFQELQMSTPTHTRIRMFNTKETYPNQSLDNDLCQAVRAGNTVYVRGQVGTDFEGNLVGLGDPRAQAEQAMRNVKQLLEEAGSDLSHIVKTTTYLIDPRYREPVYQEVGKWLKGVFPISTGLVVSGLGQPEWLMEIDVVAVIPDNWSPALAVRKP